MATKISSELMKRLNEIEKSKPEGEAANAPSPREIPVILTVTEGADIAAMEEKGFKLGRRYDNAPDIVSGTLPADKDKVKNFAEESGQVELIDYDGEMHALEEQ